MTWPRDGRISAVRSRSRPDEAGDRSMASGMEQVPPDGGDVGEDADTEHHDDTGRQLAANAELVAEVDDGSGDHHVAQEGHHEDAVVEDPVEVGAQPAEHGVEGGDDRDGQVGLQPEGHVGLEHDTEDDADHQPERGDHGCISFFCWCRLPCAVPATAKRRWSIRGGAAGSDRSSTLSMSYGMPKRSATSKNV